MPLLDRKVLGDGDMMGIVLLGDIGIVLMTPTQWKKFEVCLEQQNTALIAVS
jgi:hypothetical protein